MNIKLPKVIPIYVSEPSEYGMDSDVRFEPEEGFVLLSTDNRIKLDAAGLDDFGSLKIMIFDTPQQARDSLRSLQDFDAGSNEANFFVSGVAPSGEGLLLHMNLDAAQFEVSIKDRRAPSDQDVDEWFLSSDLDHVQVERIKEELEGHSASITSQRSMDVLIAQIEEMKLVLPMQVALEAAEGAYVALRTCNPEYQMHKLKHDGHPYDQATLEEVREAVIHASKSSTDLDEFFDEDVSRHVLDALIERGVYQSAPAP